MVNKTRQRKSLSRKGAGTVPTLRMAQAAEGHSLPVLQFEHRPEPILKAAQEYQSMPAASWLHHSK